jgi:hypothetical protein
MTDIDKNTHVWAMAKEPVSGDEVIGGGEIKTIEEDQIEQDGDNAGAGAVAGVAAGAADGAGAADHGDPIPPTFHAQGSFSMFWLLFICV